MSWIIFSFGQKQKVSRLQSAQNLADMAGGMMNSALVKLQGEMLIGKDIMGMVRYAAQFESYVAWGDIHGRHWKGRQHAVQLRCCRGRHQWGETSHRLMMTLQRDTLQGEVMCHSL